MKTKIKDILSKKQNKMSEQIIAGILLLVSMAVYFTCYQVGQGEDIWYDEVFSMKFLEHSYGEIVSLTARDVHPPLYYWYVKTIHDLAKMITPEISSVVIAKMASMLPLLGIWYYASHKIQKRFGIMVAYVFMFLVSTMPQINNYTVEIRMYMLAFFFITAIYIHSYEIVMENKTMDWAAFLVYGILTAYTQYYACVAVIAVYIALFVYFIMTKQKKQVMKVLGCAGISILAYLPWISILVRQVTAVSNSYWIQPLSLRSIFGCLKFVFLPVSYATEKNYILAVLMIGIFGVLFLYAMWKEKDSKTRYLLACGVFIPVFVTITGFVCSALHRPVFVYRYLIPGLGAMWFVCTYVLLKVRREMVMLLFLVPFLMAGHSNMEGFWAEEYKKLDNMNATNEFLEEFPKDAVILCNFNHVQALTAYYLDNENVLYGDEPEALIQELLPNCVGMTDVEDMDELVREKDVYFLGSFEAREELLEEWKQYGISYTEEGTYLLERYWFNVYHLKKEK